MNSLKVPKDVMMVTQRMEMVAVTNAKFKTNIGVLAVLLNALNMVTIIVEMDFLTQVNSAMTEISTMEMVAQRIVKNNLATIVLQLPQLPHRFASSQPFAVTACQTRMNNVMMETRKMEMAVLIIVNLSQNTLVLILPL